MKKFLLSTAFLLVSATSSLATPGNSKDWSFIEVHGIDGKVCELSAQGSTRNGNPFGVVTITHAEGRATASFTVVPQLGYEVSFWFGGPANQTVPLEPAYWADDEGYVEVLPNFAEHLKLVTTISMPGAYMIFIDDSDYALFDQWTACALK